jgi:hypothetical protein
MRSPFVLTGVLIFVLASGCSSGTDDDPHRTLPSADLSSVVTHEQPVTPSPTPAPTCGPMSAKVSKVGSGFIVELNIMSGRPNPAWRLSKSEGLVLQRLLRVTQRGIDRDGPDELGGFGVRADRGAVDILRRLDLPERFWVQGDYKIAEFLGRTLPCSAITS